MNQVWHIVFNIVFSLFAYFIGMMANYSIRYIFDPNYAKRGRNKDEMPEYEVWQTLFWLPVLLFFFARFLLSLLFKRPIKAIGQSWDWYLNSCLPSLRKRYEAYIWKKKNDAAFKNNAATQQAQR